MSSHIIICQYLLYMQSCVDASYSGESCQTFAILSSAPVFTRRQQVDDNPTRHSKISTRILKCYVSMLVQSMIAAVTVIVQHSRQ